MINYFQATQIALFYKKNAYETCFMPFVQNKNESQEKRIIALP